MRRASVRKVGDGLMSEGAPRNLMATSDTTWSLMVDDGETSNDLVTVALLANGALCSLELKKAGLVTGSSAELEGLGLLKATDKGMRGRQVWGRSGWQHRRSDACPVRRGGSTPGCGWRVQRAATAPCPPTLCHRHAARACG